MIIWSEAERRLARRRVIMKRKLRTRHVPFSNEISTPDLVALYVFNVRLYRALELLRKNYISF